ncbi:MAG TPA: alpha/beta fold hydrolase [Gaiellaceae bacterium]
MPADGLFCRDVGDGPPIVVLHGGPDFDHAYLLPELDRLTSSFRLIYYDQRGRGRSAEGVRPEDVTIQSEVDDLDRVRSHHGLESVAVLGHSWGGVLAMEYALRHPDRTSHLILLDTAPASAGDWQDLQQEFARRRPAADTEAMQAIAGTEAYARGNLEAEAAYYRIHFAMTLKPPDLLEVLVARLRSNFTAAGVLLARAIEERLYDETSRSPKWDLFPGLRELEVPTLLLHGSHDFIPVELAARIADAVPGARMTVLSGLGHFSFLEAPERVHEEIASLLVP